MQEDEATEKFLGEVADGFIGLGLGFIGFRKSDGEAGADISDSLRGGEFCEEGFVAGVVFREEFLGEFVLRQ
jgi:hypothetical protein